MADLQAFDFFLHLGEPVVRLIHSYQASRAPQALLVSGPFGVGKEALSQLLAKTILCQQDLRPCNSCPACVKVESYSHPNLLVVTTQQKQKSVKVEQTRQLLDNLSTYPFQPGLRVVLLCLIDSFTIQAQNALLKAIEEPDPETFFILTAQQEKAVLSTIRSRCRHFRFPLWPHGMVEKYLVQQGISSAEAKHLSALSGGSPGRAMQIHADPQILQVQRLVEETFLSIRNQKDFVSASQKLKDARNLADSILDYLEIAAITQIDRQTTLVSDNLFTQKLLGCVLTARKYRTSNVSWQAVVDMMLLTILEES